MFAALTLVMCLGSSFTFGTPGIGGPGKEPPGEGYCEKLARRLTRVTTINRGISATTTLMWGTEDAGLQAVLWKTATCVPGTGGCPHPATLWPDAPRLSPTQFAERRGTDFAAKVASLGMRGRRRTPKVLVNMIGLNDRAVHGSTAVEAFARYQAILADEAMLRAHVNGRRAAPLRFVNTEISQNTRCGGATPDCDVPYVEAYNALLRTTYGATAYPDPILIEMDGEFLARGGTIGGDGLHPDCHGYEVMADIVADALVTHGIARRTTSPPAETCP